MEIGQFDLYRADQRVAIKPLWAHDGWKTDKGLLEWFYKWLPVFETVNEGRVKRMYNNVLWYTGEYDVNMEYRFLRPNQPPVNIPHYTVPVVINQLYDITEQRVSKLASYKPNFDVLDVHGSESERISAENIKTCIESVRRLNRLDSQMSELDRYNMMLGEGWLGIEWDENIGEKVDGKPVGDVRYRVKDPFWILLEPKKWEDTRCMIEIYDIMHVEEVRKKWKVKDLDPDKLSTIWGWNDEETREKTAEEVIIYRLLWKPDEFIENGEEALICGQKVLTRSNGDKWKYSHGDFPFERVTDIDVPGKIFPLSVYSHIIPAQHQYNKMTSMIARAITQMAHSKWFMVKGTADRTALGNSHTIVETNPGAPFPQMVTPSPMGREVFEWHDKMKQEVGTMGAVQGVSTGQPPPNARAASMLRFYEEQELQRNGVTIDKKNDFIRRIYTKTGVVIQDYYPNNPKRMVLELGEDNRYSAFEMSQLPIGAKVHIYVQNSTGYSESASGRLEEVGFLMEKVPGYLTNDQVADVLGHKSPKKFYDIVTAAIRQAEQEDRLFSLGRAVPAPQKYEDLLTHRRTHLIFINTNTFKKMPDAYKKQMFLHMEQTEELMYEAAKVNGAYAQILATALPDFPRFTQPQELPMPTPPAPGQGQGPQAGQAPKNPVGRPPKQDTGAQAAELASGPSGPMQ